ncbi:hypothetical protein P691DRAFT_779430 [Macrolepiota fuliginosa MF-IS2]|uniref:Uncharacterized protein n=1 Tax=Macrolepiota fuliginosa MF-IS2 TaxID=1400762 RepID=A0A9P5X2Y8_9AGAR|nr:hypothetical protein P691DRAFT_779430 [Macrolepiota fuliginosa MF-IS2]
MPPPHSFLLDLESTDGVSTEEDQLTRRSIFWRVGIFGLLEGAFLTLSAIVLVHPIILNFPENISPSEAKSAFTVLFIVWHALAIAAAKDILLFVFSAEWMAQYERTGRLESQKTDRVSKLTTGILGQTQHFLSRTATTQYRLAMVLVGLFMSLGSMGPGAVVVNTVPVDVPINIGVANVTFPYYFNTTEDYKLNNTWMLDTRANSILRLELFEKMAFGFESSDNLMIPWPSKQFNASSSRIVYQSDVLSFDFNCTWYKPTVWKYSTDPERIFWQAWDKVFIMEAISEAFVPMVTWPTTFFGSSWIFAAYDTNSSSPNAPGLDLSGLPTTSRDELEPKLNGSGFAVPQTVTALVCDPQIDVYTAQVTLDKGILHAVRSDHPPVGNIDSRKILRDLYISDLIPSLAYNFPDSIYGISSSMFSSVARLLLFCSEDSPCNTSFKPFPIPEINNNMNRFFRSASKASLDGYNGTRPDIDTLSIPNFNTFTTPAVGQADKMALVASKPFFVALIIIISLVTLSLGFLCFLIEPERLLCFNLDNVSRSILDELERLDTAQVHATTSSLTLSPIDIAEKSAYPARSRPWRSPSD